MIVLDTTALVYAKGADHPLRDPCGELIEAIAARRLAATTPVEVTGVRVCARPPARARRCRCARRRLRRAALAAAHRDR
jgi:predicted nucleic acid-binding protein